MRRHLAIALSSLAAILPQGWPEKLSVGVSDQPGGAAQLKRDAPPLAFRYQYLAGGANTGSGWATWNPDGTFVSTYISESRRARLIPVFTYYQVLQSTPSLGDEKTTDLGHLKDRAVMRAVERDLRLFFKRAKGRRLVVLHVEPDLWGYVQHAARRDDARTVPGAVTFARTVVRLRDRLAPNVALAWHLSVWGTREDPTFSKPSLAHMSALGRRSARFYRSFRARFDLVFTDVADRDAGFREHILGDGGVSRWDAQDFARHASFIRAFTRRTRRPVVIWQIPLGNDRLDDTWGRFRDNRVEWWLGPGNEANLRAERDAGVVALLFGGGADGTTGPRTDGGYFFGRVRALDAPPLR